MKRLLILLSVLALFFSCSDIDASKYDKDNDSSAEGYVDWATVKIGDKFNISKTTTATDTTFDYTGLGLGIDAGSSGISYYTDLDVKYLSDATTNSINVLKYVTYWDLLQNTKTGKIYDTTDATYKATIKHSDTTIDFTVPINATNIKVKGFVFEVNKYYTDFFLKGLNNGTGEVVVTGYTNTYYDGRPPVSEGDVDMDTPLQ